MTLKAIIQLPGNSTLNDMFQEFKASKFSTVIGAPIYDNKELVPPCPQSIKPVLTHKDFVTLGSRNLEYISTGTLTTVLNFFYQYFINPEFTAVEIATRIKGELNRRKEKETTPVYFGREGWLDDTKPVMREHLHSTTLSNNDGQRNVHKNAQEKYYR